MCKIDRPEPALTEPMNDPIAPNPGRIAVLDADGPVPADLAGQVDNAHAATTMFLLNLVIAGVAAGRQVAVGSVAVSSLGRSDA